MLLTHLIYFEPAVCDRLIASLLSLPETERPRRYGLGERPTKCDGDVSDLEEFAGFRKKYTTYNLRASKCGYERVMRRGKDSSLSVSSKYGIRRFRVEDYSQRAREPLKARAERCPEGEEQSLLIMEHVLKDVPIRFAYAAQHDELSHRNGFYREYEVNGGTMRMPLSVGLDYTRYFPGVYWMTAISADLLARHRIHLDEFPEWLHVSTYAPLGGKTYLLRPYDHSWQWQDYAAKIDDLCERLPGCFSVRRIREELMEALTPAEFSSAVARWR
jgi:hypothetical protein